MNKQEDKDNSTKKRENKGINRRKSNHREQRQGGNMTKNLVLTLYSKTQNRHTGEKEDKHQKIETTLYTKKKKEKREEQMTADKHTEKQERHNTNKIATRQKKHTI